MIIIPVYQEDPSILDETLQSLAQQNVSMLVGIALEERELNISIKYNHIIQKYGDRFLKVITTIHPSNLPNEIPGKSSNCDYCARMLVQYYEKHLKDSYNYTMITSCDCDSIWSNDYFLYLNYLCTKNNLKSFDHIVYAPNITNMKHFQSNHLLSNWMSIARSVVTHGHFRRLGYICCFTSEYHIPLNLLKKIDYWDADLVHEDVHMCNKLAIIDEEFLSIQSTYLPCDNHTPTDIHSIFGTLVLLWNQSLRWNLYVYDIYYLFHMLLLNMFGTKSYENFRTDSWKILQRLIITYETLFFFFIAPISNNFFWLFYLCFFTHHLYTSYVSFLLNFVQPTFIIIQILLGILYAFVVLNSNDEATRSELYSWKKYLIFILGFVSFSIFAVIYQGMNTTIAWAQTLKNSLSHSEATIKTVFHIKH